MRALERSMRMLRTEGWFCAKAEHWNAFAKVRQDLFGFVDVVALPPTQPQHIHAIQVVNTHVPEHITKIRQSREAGRWLDCGGRIVIHNWKHRSKNKVKHWECEVIEVRP